MTPMMNAMRPALVAGLLLALAACGGGGAPGTTDTGASAGPQRAALRARASRDYQLSWQPVSSPQASGYRLYYATASSDAAAAWQPLASATSPDYVVRTAALDVAQGSTLLFAVSATYGNEESALSEPVSVIVN